ncbi:MAG: TauD/TfdA family dioxygenase [Arenicellales bacterium]
MRSVAAADPAIVGMEEYTPYAGTSRLVSANRQGRGVALTWDDDLVGFFHDIWLRDHCACPVCRHPRTRERLFRIIDLPAELPVPDARITAAGALELRWPPMPGFESHHSLFDPGWLRQRADGAAREPLSVDRKTPWDASLVDRLPEVDYGEFMRMDEGLATWLQALDRYGLAIIRNGPAAEGEVLRVAERVGWPRESNFGRLFDVFSKPDPNNAAYTDIALEPHADLPNWERPPDFQLLYCLSNDARGGDSTLTDGYAVSEALKAEDPEAFRLLNELAIDFRFQDETSDIAWRAPVIGCDEHGNPVVIRFNNWIREALRLPSEQVEPFYRAYRRLWELLRDPRYTLRVKLRPGEMIAFDNLRVLHGRDAFDPNSGRRHLQGAYLDRDLIRSRQRVLSRSST